MAARILAKRKVIAYIPDLSVTVKHLSTFKYVDRIATHSTLFPSLLFASESTQASFVKENINISKDLAFLSCISINEKLPKTQTNEVESDFLNQFKDKKLPMEDQESLHLELIPLMDNLQCLAINCNEAMKKEFKGLFKNHDIQSDQSLSVITLSRKTTNDMSSWSPDVEEEREFLLEQFIEGAKIICASFHKTGYWADFVDPESGRPFYSSYTPDTFFETDFRYKKLGFEINDLGCCKVIVHSKWGVYVYVGSLFTNAPIDHPVIAKLTQ